MDTRTPAPDLRQRPPRSPRVRLGGFVVLARLLDKGRAAAAGLAGEYHYGSDLDRRFLDFVGIDPHALFARLATGGGDGEILEWIVANASPRPDSREIARWTAGIEADTDLSHTLDLLDLDDYVSFGGQA